MSHHHYHSHGSRVHLRPGTIGYTVQTFFMAVVFFIIGCFMVGLFVSSGGAITIVVALFLFGFAGLLVFLGIRSIRMMRSGGPDAQNQMPPGGYASGQYNAYQQQPPPPRF